MLRSLEAHGVFAIGAHCLDPKKLATQRHSGSARWACKHIIRKRNPAKVITLVRHPIENMLSTYARSDFGRQDRSDKADQAETPSADQLLEEFIRSYLQTNRYLKPLNWFADEFQAALGINVYEHPFDKRNGFARFRDSPYDVLIMRTELSDERKAELTADLVGVPEFTMTSATAVSDERRRLPPGKPGDQTDYAAKYRALKESIEIPQPYLDGIVGSQFVRHFFTQEQRDEMRTRFGGAIADKS